MALSSKYSTVSSQRTMHSSIVFSTAILSALLCLSHFSQAEEEIDPHDTRPRYNDNCTSAIMFFHGLGGTGKTCKAVLSKIKLPGMRIVCPSADPMHIAIHDYYDDDVPAWFDIKHKMHAVEDIEGIDRVTEWVHRLIQEQADNGVPPERVILAGFCQGGAVALHAALTYPKKLAGIVAMHTWLPKQSNITEIVHTVQKDIPILQCHGEDDEIVPLTLGEASALFLKRISRHVQMKTYAGINHTLADAEIHDLGEFAKKHIAHQIRQH